MIREIVSNDPILTMAEAIGSMHHENKISLRCHILKRLTILLNSTEYPDIFIATQEHVKKYDYVDPIYIETSSLKIYGIDCEFEFTPYVEPGKLVYFETSVFQPMTNFHEKGLFWNVYTRLINGDRLTDFGFYEFVDVATVPKVNNMYSVIQKDLLFGIAGTGIPFVILKCPKFSPFDYSVAIPTDRYIEYVFKVLSFDTAVRFSADFISERLETSIKKNVELALCQKFKSNEKN